MGSEALNHRASMKGRQRSYGNGAKTWAYCIAMDMSIYDRA